jgi:DNA-directed RNA polymerase subunit omega
MKLIEGFDSNYRYVLVAARRARQIQNGARPTVEPHSRKPCRIAEEEVQAGMVKWEIPPVKTAAAMEVVAEPTNERVGGEADD